MELDEILLRIREIKDFFYTVLVNRRVLKKCCGSDCMIKVPVHFLPDHPDTGIDSKC